MLRTERDDPSIGLLLYESHSGPEVELTFEEIQKPIGVSTYRVTQELPTAIREELPTVEDLQELVSKLPYDPNTLAPDSFRAVLPLDPPRKSRWENPLRFLPALIPLGTGPARLSIREPEALLLTMTRLHLRASASLPPRDTVQRMVYACSIRFNYHP